MGRRRGFNGQPPHHFNGVSKRPQSEMIISPMSEIHPRPLTTSTRNGMPPRPNSVLEDPSYFPPLSPPPDFHSGYMSDVPTSSLTSNRRPRRGSRPETAALTLSSFKPIPSISQPTPEEIQRDVDIVFHNLGLDSQSPIRDHGTLMSPQDAVNGYNLQDAVDYNLDDSMCHSITEEEGMLLGAPPPPQD